MATTPYTTLSVRQDTLNEVRKAMGELQRTTSDKRVSVDKTIAEAVACLLAQKRKLRK
jgi:hypothetical protein